MTKAYLIDMDGVLINGPTPIPGAPETIERLKSKAIPFLIFTNNARLTPEDQATRLNAIGFNVTADHIYTSALAAADFLSAQAPNARVFPIGRAVAQALLARGFTLVDEAPDYVVLGEANTYDFERIEKGTALIVEGARFISTNPEISGYGQKGFEIACGGVALMMAGASGREPYFLGKPNPLMMRQALALLGRHSGETALIGDRVETDIRAGMESGLRTILVLSGVTTPESLQGHSFRPDEVLDSIADLAV